jgi:hypothetical protein
MFALNSTVHLKLVFIVLNKYACLIEPLVPEPSPFEVEIAIAKLKNYKSLGNDQIPAGGETLQSKIHKLNNFIWSKEELPDQWKEYIILPIYKKNDKTD